MAKSMRTPWSLCWLVASLPGLQRSPRRGLEELHTATKQETATIDEMITAERDLIRARREMILVRREAILARRKMTAISEIETAEMTEGRVRGPTATTASTGGSK